MRIADKITPISRQVNYGPNRGSAEWQARGAYTWHCNAGCLPDGGMDGGFCHDLNEAKNTAEKHARGHRGMRAVYYEG